jgi:hypothetical protein
MYGFVYSLAFLLQINLSYPGDRGETYNFIVPQSILNKQVFLLRSGFWYR